MAGGWSPLNAFRSSFKTPEGEATYPLPVALFYAKAAASPRYLFPLFTPFLLLGLAAAIRGSWPMRLLIVGWGLVVYVFLSGIPYQNFRFALALLPVEAVLTAVGLRSFWEWLTPRRRPAVLIYLLVGLVGGVWYSARVVEAFVVQKQADLAVARWVDEQGRRMPPDSPWRYHDPGALSYLA